jgi:hypothetical protein
LNQRDIKQRNYCRSKQVRLSWHSYRKARERKNREVRTYRSLAGGDGTAASVQREIQSPNNVTERSGGGVIEKGVGCRRALAPAWSRATAVELLLCSSVRR